MKKNDTENIVKEFLELWQKQCAYISRDSDSVNQAFASFKQMQESCVNGINSRQEKSANAKSVSTADILGNIGNEFIKLAESYAGLEKRIAKLESSVAAAMATSTKKTSPGKSGRSGKRA